MRRRKSRDKKEINLQEVIGKGYNKIWNSRSFWLVVKGSRASKKSTTMALRWIYLIMQYPWGNLLVMRRYGKTNRNSTYAQLKWAINRLGVQHLFDYNETLPRITYKPTGQQIIFSGLDSPLKNTSMTVANGVLSWVWLDEAYEVETFDKVQTIAESIRSEVDAEGFFQQFVITFNPWHGGWLKENFWDNPLPDSEAYTTTYRANEFISQKVIDRMESIRDRDPRRAMVTLDGEFGIADGLVFEHLFEVRDLSNLDKTGLIKLVGQDFGFEQDASTIVVAWLDQVKHIVYITQEWYVLHARTRDIHQGQIDMGVINDTIMADSAEKRLIAELREMGAKNMYATVKGKGSVASGVQYMKDYNYVIHHELEHTIEEFNLYSYKKDQDDNMLNEPIDANNHIIDPLRYTLLPFMGKKVKSEGAFSSTNVLDRLKKSGL